MMRLACRPRSGGLASSFLFTLLVASLLGPGCLGEAPEGEAPPVLCFGGSCDDSLGLILHLCDDEDAEQGAYGCREASAQDIGLDPDIAVSPVRLRFVTRGLSKVRGLEVELQILDGDDLIRAIPITDLEDGRHSVTWDGRDEDGDPSIAPFHSVRLIPRVADDESAARDVLVVATLFNLPDEGAGYYHFSGSDGTDKDDWGRVHVIDAIVAVGDEWSRAHRIGIGDLSLQNGGGFPPHVTHRHGECIDIRYVSTDGEEPLSLASRAGRRAHDVEATQELVDLLLAHGAEEVLADSRSGLEGSAVRFVSGHANHFHVTFPLLPPERDQ